MHNRQLGVTLLGLITGLFVLIIVALFGMKLVPAYIEFYTAKGAIEAIAREKGGTTPAEVRRAFDARSAIDDINAVRAQDLDISKDGNQLVIGFAYRKEVPIAGNLGVYIDFAASSRGN